MVRTEMTSKEEDNQEQGWLDGLGQKGRKERKRKKARRVPQARIRISGFSQFTDLGKDRKEKERGKEKRVRFEK